MFVDELHKLCGGSLKYLKDALLEVGVDRPEQIKRNDRVIVKNIIKRRKRPDRRKNFVQGDAPLESNTGWFSKVPDEYAGEKGVPSIEHGME